MRALARYVVSSLAVATFVLAVCCVFDSLRFVASAQTGAQANAETIDVSDEADVYTETARIARVGYVEGDVTLLRDGEAESVVRNLPLVEGDTLTLAGSDTRVEVQLDKDTHLRLSGDGRVRFTTLRDEGVAVSLPHGSLIVRLENYNRDARGYFEVDVPQLTATLEASGEYRFDVERERRERFTVREGGVARLYTENDNLTLRSNRTAERFFANGEYGDWSLLAAVSPDYFDGWSRGRDAELARVRGDDERDARTGINREAVWGAEELASYGDWIETTDYGRVWRPSPSSINGYANWTPYRYGEWRWCPPYGWTWVGAETWSWTPYHYGRWVRYRDSWCWTPRADVRIETGRENRSLHRAWHRWRPALVVFVTLNINRRETVCWRPLWYGERDPRGRRSRRENRDHPRGSRQADHRQGERPPRGGRPGQIANPVAANPAQPTRRLRVAVRDPALQRAYSGLTFDEFRRQRRNPQALSPQQIAQAVAAEPSSGVANGDDDVVPPLRRGGAGRARPAATSPNPTTGVANTDTNNPNGATERGRRGVRGGRERINERINPPDTSVAAEGISPSSTEPATGVAPRRAGEALTDELRRRRALRNNEPRRRAPRDAQPTGNANTSPIANPVMGNNPSGGTANDPASSAPVVSVTPRDAEVGDTGIVTRPTPRRPARREREARGEPNATNQTSDANNSQPNNDVNARPARRRDTREAEANDNSPSRIFRRPSRVASDGGETPVAPAAQPSTPSPATSSPTVEPIINQPDEPSSPPVRPSQRDDANNERREQRREERQAERREERREQRQERVEQRQEERRQPPPETPREPPPATPPATPPEAPRESPRETPPPTPRESPAPEVRESKRDDDAPRLDNRSKEEPPDSGS